MAKKFEAPGNIADLEAADLEAAVKAAFDRVEELRPKDGASVSDEDFAELTAIKEFIVSAKEENAAREAAAAERDQMFADLDAELAAAVPAEDPAEPGAEGADGAEENGEPAAAPAAEELPKEEAAAEAAAPAGELVSASAKKAPANFKRGSFAARAAKSAPASQAPAAEAPGAKLISNGNIKQFQAGQSFSSLTEAAQVLSERARTLPKTGDNIRVTSNALSIVLPQNTFSDNSADYQGRDGSLKMLMEAADETRLPGGSLVAAGGWGAPSERSLDFCELESIEGLYSLPEVNITRGGIEYTKGPVFADILGSSTGFWDMTEAEAEAGTELKTSLRPSLPTFEEQRLDAVGVMLEAGLLLRQGWPEVIARHADLLMKAHAYKLAQKKLGLVRGFTGPAKAAPIGFGNALDIFHILELVATGERQRTFMSPNQTLEAVIPHWVKNVVRVDIANRNGVQDVKSITDAQIDAEFTARKIKVQWITADQNLTLTNGIAAKYPDVVDIIMYPAGTFVAGVAPVISLDTIYDSTNLKKNDYVHLFVEQGVLVTNPCGDGVRISLPLYANGRRAVDNIANNFGTAAA